MLVRVGSQDILSFGLVRIYRAQPNDFLSTLRSLRTWSYDLKNTAFGFPSKWAQLKDTVGSWYYGMREFVYFCEPMLDFVDMSVQKDSLAIRRKFRNKWTQLWMFLGKNLNLSEADINIMSSFGICMAELEPSSIPSEVIDFYNVVLKWFVMAQSESSMNEHGVDIDKLLTILATSDSKEFVEMVRKS